MKRLFFKGTSKDLKEAGLVHFDRNYSTPLETYCSLWFKSKQKNKRLILITDTEYPDNGDEYLFNFLQEDYKNDITIDLEPIGNLQFNNMSNYFITKNGIYLREVVEELQFNYNNSIKNLFETNKDEFAKKCEENPYTGMWLQKEMYDILFKLRDYIVLEDKHSN